MTKNEFRNEMTVALNGGKREGAKNDITELVFILDRSGSMSGLESDTVGGFNGLIEKQKKSDAPCFVSTVLFDNETEVLHDRVRLQDVKPITEKEYYVRGCTALLDALGGAIKHIDMIHKYARPEDVPANTLFTVITDGLENASRKFGSDEVKRMIEAHKEKGWEFIFIGANIDAVETAKHIGISADRAVNYHADTMGTQTVYEAVSEAVTMNRCAAPMSAKWRENLDADYENRRDNGGTGTQTGGRGLFRRRHN